MCADFFLLLLFVCFKSPQAGVKASALKTGWRAWLLHWQQGGGYGIPLLAWGKLQPLEWKELKYIRLGGCHIQVQNETLVGGDR